MSGRALAWAMVLMVPVAASWSCTEQPAAAGTPSEARAATIERLTGTDLSRVILSARAAERLGIETTPVREVQRLQRLLAAGVVVAAAGAAPASADPERRTVVPYAAVLYDARGDSWVYTNPEGLVFVRHRIVVDDIDGELAILLDGPPTGTAVVTVGAAQLLGAELEIGHRIQRGLGR